MNATWAEHFDAVGPHRINVNLKSGFSPNGEPFKYENSSLDFNVVIGFDENTASLISPAYIAQVALPSNGTRAQKVVFCFLTEPINQKDRTIKICQHFMYTVNLDVLKHNT